MKRHLAMLLATTGVACGRSAIGPPDLTDGPPPAPLRPFNGEYTGSVWAKDSLRPRFLWTAPPGATRHEIEVDDSCPTGGFAACPFPSPELVRRDLGEPSFRPDEPLAAATTPPVGRRYFWRTRACTGLACSRWSAVRYVNVGRQQVDINGDGYADVRLMTGPFYGLETDDRPAHASLLLGDPSLTLGPAISLDSARRPGDLEFGFAIAMPGDLDGDGYSDLVVGGRPDVEHRYTDFTSAVLVFRGGAVVDLLPDATWPMPSTAMVLSALGDFDADGHADLLVRLLPHVQLGVEARAFVMAGDPDLAGVRLATIADPDSSRLADVYPGGDVNADGAADVVGFVDAVTSQRLVAFLGGVRNGEVADLFAVHNPYGDSPRSAAGDMNGDGFADVFAVEHEATASAWWDAVSVHSMASNRPGGGSVLATWVSEERGAYFGSLVGAADLDGDGYDDAVVSAWGSTADGAYGRAYVFRGGRPVSDAADLVIARLRTGCTPEFSFACHLGGVIPVGDLDGDGYHDLMGSLDGRLAIYRGGKTLDAVPDRISDPPF